MEPLGESQVLSYLELLSEDYQIYLISFEKLKDFRGEKKRVFEKRLQKMDINWRCLKYRHSPSNLSILFNISLGLFFSLFLLIRSKIRIIHIRSLLPGLMILPLKVFFRFKLIFDMRGFWPDEKADRAGWGRTSYKYLLAEYFQRKLIIKSDKVVTLTKEAKKIILEEFHLIDSSRIETIPTCTNIHRFKLLDFPDQDKYEIIFGHLGSVDTAYNIDPILNMVKGFQEINKKVKIIFFSRGSHQHIKSRIRYHKLLEGSYEIKEVDFESLPSQLSKIHFGCFFANYSKSIVGSLPTKIGEFLSSGRPIICNPANTDISEIIKNNKVGLVERLESHYSAEELFSSLQVLKEDKQIQIRSRNFAESFFSLNLGVSRYKKIYIDLIGL